MIFPDLRTSCSKRICSISKQYQRPSNSPAMTTVEGSFSGGIMGSVLEPILMITFFVPSGNLTMGKFESSSGVFIGSGARGEVGAL